MIIMKKSDKLIYWAPRVVALAFTAFLALFSLDIFDGHYGFWGTVVGLLMHNIPVFVLMIIIALAWRREWVGALGFFLAGLLYLGLVLASALKNPLEFYMLSYSLIIAGPAFLVGGLFLLNWRRRSISSKMRESG